MSATRSSSTRGGHEEAEWARSLAMECPRTDKARKKNASSIESSRDPINRLSGISRRAHRRAAVAVSSVSRCARWSSRRAVRSGRSCRWPRAARARAARDEPSAGAAVAVVRPAVAPAGVVADAGAPPLPAGKPRGRRAASELRLPDGAGTSARTPRARRVAACPRRGGPPATPSPRETAMSRRRRFLRVTRRSACRSSWRGAGCAADARPRSSSAEAWSPWKARWRSRATRRCRTRA